MKHNTIDKIFEWVLNNKVSAFIVGALFLILPPTGKGLSSTKDWNDQNLFWQGVINLQEKNDASWSHDGWVGPGYVGIVRAISRIFAIDATNAMVLTNRICFAVAGTFIALTVQQILAESSTSYKNKKRIIIVCVVGFALIPVFSYSDIPWTNFLTYSLWSVSIYLLFTLQMLKEVKIINFFKVLFIGFLGFYTRQVREADGLILIIFGVIFICLKLYSKQETKITYFINSLKYLVTYIFGLILSWLTIGVLSGNYRIFSQYWKVEEIFPGYKDLYFTGIISRFVGVFVDPCFNSYCPDNSYTGLLDDLSRIWAQPILLQIASLGPVLLILAFLTLKLIFQAKIDLTVMYFFLILGTGLTFIVGYTSLTVLNGSVIKFGTSREFFLPTMLLILSLAYIMTKNKFTIKEISMTSRLFVSFSFIMFILALTIGLPRFENHHVMRVFTSIEAGSCKIDSKCQIEMTLERQNNLKQTFSTEGWVEAIYKPNYITENKIKTTGITVQEVIPGKKLDVYRKWYKMSGTGYLPTEIENAVKTKGLYTLIFVPIYLGVQGTPTHTEHIKELTIQFDK